MRRPVSTSGCDSRCRFAVKRFAFGPSGRRFGDRGTGHPPCGCEVGPWARWAGDGDRDVLLQGAVPGRVIGRPVLPAAPDDAAPGASERANRALVVVAACSRSGVVISRPGMPVPGAVSERVKRAAEPFVASPAKARDLAFAGLHGDRGLAGVAGERVGVGVVSTTSRPSLRKESPRRSPNRRGETATGRSRRRGVRGSRA
jgi:hypothetical protein